MADEEAGGLEHAKERCSLLKALKCTVESLIISDLESNWDSADRLKRMINDLERILRHGQRKKPVSFTRRKNNDIS